MPVKDSFIAMIPARIGSTRLKRKNLALINHKPLISYAIEAAKESNAFSRIVLNSDHPVFADIAARHGVEFYQRPPHLGSSRTKVDSVVFDFFSKYETDCLAWLNPTSPLQTGDEIKGIIDFFLKERLDSLVTVKNEQVHSVYKDKPINFSTEDAFSRTQDLVPVQPFVYSVVAWKKQTFLDTFDKKGYAFFCGKVGYYPVSKETSIIIKTKEDLMLVDYIIKAKESLPGYEVKYDNLIEKLNGFK